MNKSIKILDCTLRDGGYVNDWRFGFNAIKDVKNALDEIGIDFIELGFFRNEDYSLDRSIYNGTDKIAGIIGNKKEGTIYGGLIEMANYFPIESLSSRTEDGPDAIRYSFWKRKIDEAYDYCRKIKERGYLLSCQPTRIEQYSEQEFAELCDRFSRLEPYAVYIVDTFGLLREEDLLKYTRIANEYLDANIVLGYHAHDNMGQAFKNVCAFIEEDCGNRTIQIDASICGMGRGAGNLRLEQLLEHLNYKYKTDYDLSPIYKIWDKYLQDIKEKYPWGFDLAYFITAGNNCNPNYASHYIKKNLSVEEINKIIYSIKGSDKYLYSDDLAEIYAEGIINAYVK